MLTLQVLNLNVFTSYERSTLETEEEEPGELADKAQRGQIKIVTEER